MTQEDECDRQVEKLLKRHGMEMVLQSIINVVNEFRSEPAWEDIEYMRQLSLNLGATLTIYKNRYERDD